MERKDELSKAQIDKEYSYQVIIASDALMVNLGDLFCANLGVPVRTHSVHEDDKPYIVYCFADVGHARSFIELFGGERFDPVTGQRMPLWSQIKQ
jgi:hypothetical protein